jgi:hypothetical protein
VLPPGTDRGDQELGGVGADPDRHEPLVAGKVVDSVGDGFAELLVGEVVRVDLDRPAAGLVLAPDRLVVADELLLFGVHADHRLSGGDRRPGGLVDVLELPVAVGMIAALARLAVGLHAVAQTAQQLADGAIRHLMAVEDPWDRLTGMDAQLVVVVGAAEPSP